MTILSFVEGAPRARGGMGLVGVPSILRSVAARGHRVAVLMGGPPNPDHEELTVSSLGAALHRKEGAGMFGTVNFKASSMWAFAPGILPTARPYVQQADFVTLHSLYSFPVLAGYLLARSCGKPYAVWPHGVLAPFQRTVSQRKKRIYDLLFTRQILDNASVLFFSAAGELEEARNLRLRPPAVVVPDGMDATAYANLPPRGAFRARYLPTRQGPLVAFLARLNAKKGLDLLVKSMALVAASHPDASLAIVGPPDPYGYEHQVERWVRESGVGRQTVITGPVPHSAKLELLADADVFVLPSEAENFGHSVFEAMASGVPVVVSDTLNYAAEIAQSGAGFAVARTSEAFAARIVELLAAPAMRARMGEEGRRLARRYSWEETGKTVESILSGILAGRRTATPVKRANGAQPVHELNLVTFSEGALPRKGGIGIAGVPLIMGSTASKGNHVVTLLAGPPTPGREAFTAHSVEEARNRRQGPGTFGIVPFEASNTWAFSPAMFRNANRLVKDSDFVGLHSLYSFPVALGYALARYHRKPYFVWLHGVLATFQRQVSPHKKWLYDRLLARRILSCAAVIFFTARGEREQTRPLGLTAPNAVVPTGFVAEEYKTLPPRGAFRARHLNGFDGPLILFLGRLNAKKGLDLLARAMARVFAARSGARLAIAGPPDPPSFEPRVAEWIEESGIQSCTVVTGPLDPPGRLEALADSDIFVTPSHAENFGFSVFEAMASGIPVVVADTLDYAQEISAKGAGLAVPRDAAAFADAIVRLLDDGGLRRQMGQKGSELANTYSWRATGERVDRVLRAVLAGQPIPADLAQ